ncbi:hypothetical protein Tco_0515474 [Tanacetum coccineum]
MIGGSIVRLNELGTWIDSVGLDSYVVTMEKGFMNGRDVEEKVNLVDQARETTVEIENEQAGVNKEFPSMNDVFGDVSNTSFTGMGSQTYAKLLKHDSSMKKVNFRSLEAPTCDGADIAIPMSSVLKSMIARGIELMLENGPGMMRSIPIVHRKWTPNSNLCKGDLTSIPVSSFARTLIDSRADVDLKESMAVVVPSWMGKNAPRHDLRVQVGHKPNPLFTYRPKKDVEKAKKEKKSKKETNGKTVDTSTKVSNAFDVMSSMADLEDDVGMNSNVHLVNEKEDQELKMKNKEELARAIVKSLLATTYVYEADEQYNYIMSPSTTTDVEDDTDDEDESEDTNVEDKDDENESEDG